MTARTRRPCREDSVTRTLLPLLILTLGLTAAAAVQPRPVSAQEPDAPRYPLQRDSLWGYIDAAGRWAIEPRYPGALPFTEGLAGVQDPGTGAWGFIGPDGAWVIEPRFGGGPYAGFQRPVDPFSEGLAPVQVGTAQDRRLGMIDRTGAVVFEGEYQALHGLSEGLARAETDEGYGYLDRNGEWVIEPRFHEAGDFSEGLAAVAREFGDDLGYIDPTGEWVIEPVYRDAGPFAEGRAPVERDFDDFYIDRSGQTVIAGPFDRVRPFREGLALAQPEDSSGFVFLDPNGDVAIRSVDGRPICFGLGYHNGLARVWVAAEGQECGGFSFTGEPPLVEQVDVPNTRVAYIDRTGQAVYMQSADELRAAQAREDSIRAAREAAEAAEEAARERAERDRLAACPDGAVYGDSGLPNWLEIGNAGKTVRFYFRDAAVRMTGPREFEVIPPAFRKQGAAMGIQLRSIQVEPDFFDRSNLAAEINGYASSAAFCLTLPDAVTDDTGSESTVDVLARPEDDGELVVDLRIVSDADSTDYVAGHFATSMVVMPPEERPELDSYGTWQGRPVTSASFTYDPAAGSLSYAYGRASDGGGSVHSSGGVGGFRGEPGTFRRLDRVENEVVIHRVTAFGPEEAEVELYRVPVREPSEDEQRSFFAPVQAELTAYDPEDGEHVATLRSNQIRIEPSVEPVTYGDDGRVVGPGSDAGPMTLTPGDLEAGQAPELTGVTPYDLAYTVAAPGAPGRRYTATAGAGGESTAAAVGGAAAGAYRLTVRYAGADQSPEVVGAAMLYGAFTAGMEAVQGGAQVSVMRDTVRAVLDELGIDYDAGTLDAESPNALAEAVFGIAQANFSMEALRAAQQMSEGEGEPPLPVTVLIDGRTGQPVRSERTVEPGGEATRIAIDYASGQAMVTAENAAQGREQRAFPIPDGTLDLFQLRHALAFLPLADGYSAAIPLFDVAAHQAFEVRFSTASGSTASSAVKVEALYSRATVTVEGRETVATDAGPVDAWRVRLTLEGDPLQLPGLRAVARATEGWPIEATYWLAVDAPHTLLRATYPGSATLTAEP